MIVRAGMIFAFLAPPWLQADEVDMRNGDRYFGTVLSVSADTVVLESNVLGKINVPRKEVASLTFGAKSAPPQAAPGVAQNSAPTNPPAAGLLTSLSLSNLDLAAAFRSLGANTNFIGQIRQEFIADHPEAASNYDTLVRGLMNGTLNLDDLRRQARSAVDQLKEMKRDLGPDASASFDGYLEVLENFLNETGGGPTNAAPLSQAKP